MPAFLTRRNAIIHTLVFALLVPGIATAVYAQDAKNPNCTVVLHLKPGYTANVKGKELQKFQKDGKHYAVLIAPPKPMLKGLNIVPIPFSVVSPDGASREYLLVGFYGAPPKAYDLTTEDYLGTTTQARTQGFLITVSSILEIEIAGSSANAKNYRDRKQKLYHLSKTTSESLTRFINQCQRMDIEPNTLVETKKLAMQFGTLANLCAPPESKTEALQKLAGNLLKIATRDFSGKPLGEQASTILRQCSDQVSTIVLSYKYRSTDFDKIVMGRLEPMQKVYSELSDWAEDIYEP